MIGANAAAIKSNISAYPVQLVENPNYQQGLSSSIVAGILALEKDQIDTVLIMLADQPKITASHLNDLIASFHANPHLAVATAYEKNLGVPALFSKQHFESLRALSGDKGARMLLKQLDKTINRVPFSVLADIDTPEDYRDLLDNEEEV